MREHYEKQGATARLESSARGTNLVRLREAGWAEVADGSFSCGPLPVDPTLASRDMRALHHVEKSIREIVRGRAPVERLTIVSGFAAHSVVRDGKRRRRWADASARVFITLVHPTARVRASLALGGPAVEEIDLAPIDGVCQALAFPSSHVNDPSSVVLEPWVSAGLIRTLADHRVELSGALRLVQSPPPDALDGAGKRPRRRIVRKSADMWPEIFRPSYRFEASPWPLHADLVATGEAAASADLVVVAASSNWRRDSSRHFSTSALLTNPDRRTLSICEIAVDTGEWKPARVQTGREMFWFPEGAGAWGRALTLRRPAVALRSL